MHRLLIASSRKKDNDMEFTLEQWEENWDQEIEKVYYDPDDRSIRVNRSYIEKYMGPSAKLFLEAGCGTARSSLDTALNHPDISVVCLDIAPTALLIAKRLFRENNASGFFVCGDIRALPFRTGAFDFIFSDGAIEHFKETSRALSELYRVLGNGGRILVTVPYVSIPMLTHGQLHGNIPNLPILRSLLEFIHMRVFKGRFMKNGYELSFTQTQLKSLLNKFSKVEVGLFHGGRLSRFCFFRWPLLMKIRRLICYMIYGFAVKQLPN